MPDVMDAILLIEDSPQIAVIIVSKLRREGFEVVWKRDGDAASRFLEIHSPSLILLSTFLDQKNAWDILRELRVSHPDVPTILLLEHEEAPEADRARAMGCVHCVIKPFKPSVLARVVKGILADKTSTEKVPD